MTDISQIVRTHAFRKDINAISSIVIIGMATKITSPEIILDATDHCSCSVPELSNVKYYVAADPPSDGGGTTCLDFLSPPDYWLLPEHRTRTTVSGVACSLITSVRVYRRRLSGNKDNIIYTFLDYFHKAGLVERIDREYVEEGYVPMDVLKDTQMGYFSFCSSLDVSSREIYLVYKQR